jgi:hypothetical protein
MQIQFSEIISTQLQSRALPVAVSTQLCCHSQSNPTARTSVSAMIAARCSVTQLAVMSLPLALALVASVNGTLRVDQLDLLSPRGS